MRKPRTSHLLSLAGIAIASLVFLPATASAQGAMTNGASHAGAIVSAGGIDVWTFTATAGDSIILAIGEVGPDSAFVPWIRLTRPDAVLIGNVSGVYGTQLEVAATLTGTYTVQVASNDAGNNDVGDYLLTLAKSPGAFTISPGDDGGGLTNGSNHTGSIHVGDLDMWSFDATAGDSIILRVGEVGPNGVLTPWIRLKSPTGQNLGTSSGVMATEIEAVATVTGSYTVIVNSNDAGWDATGDYTLTLAKSPGAFTISPGDDGGGLTNGSNHTGTIHVGDVDMWSFNATAGDAIVLRIGEVGPDGAFTPWIRLKSPTGQSLGTTSGLMSTEIEATATVTGIYTVIVTTNDAGWDATGDYTLTLAKAPGAFTISPGDDGGGLTNGSNHTGTIHVGDLDMWSFSATAGDSIVLRIGEVGADGAFTPWIRLKSPTGQSLGTSSGLMSTEIEAVATVTGTYTVIVTTNDAAWDATGDYTLTLAKGPGAFTISPGDEGGALNNGTNHAGTIHVGDLDMWSFTATAGDAIILRIGEVGPNGPLTPWIRLKSPTGQNLGTISGVMATEIEAVATVTGTYTVIATTNDAAWDATGEYQLTLARVPAAFSTSLGDEGGVMTNGGNHVGTIHVGDVDMWSFTATAGESLTVSIGEVGPNSDYTPWIRLKSPTGQNLGTISGVMATQLSATATVTGTYTVIVTTNDAAWDATGNYTLTIANTPRAFVVPLGDNGGAMVAGDNSGTIHVGDLDMWTFSAHAGDPLVVVMTDVNSPGSDFAPWIRLRSPTGALIGSQSGVTTAQVLATAPLTGIYTIVAGTLDPAFDGFGDYTLSVAGVSSSMIRNGNFDAGETSWQFFATPTPAYIVHNVTGGVLNYYRVPPPPGTANQAVAYQETGVSLPAFAPVHAQFDLANTTTARKRISVLVVDADFSDLSVCTFWLEAGAPMRTYQMRTHTTEVWTGAALYFYAASAGNDGGGFYQVDNVSMAYVPEQSDERTDCVDPTAPAPPGGPSGPNLLVNGDFNTGTLAPWFTFGTITTQITAGVLEFLKASITTPAGVVAQPTGQTMTAGQILTTTLQLGNSSAVRKRVTVILHDSDFTDLAACTFWLTPGQPLSDYTVRMFATKAWTNAMVSIYPATVGVQQWILADNVTFQRTPSTATVGTECVEPGAESAAFAEAARLAPAPDIPVQVAVIAMVGSADAAEASAATSTVTPGQALVVADTIDLREVTSATLTFESALAVAASHAVVQVSIDGINWITVHKLSASDDWESTQIDLTAFLGEVIRVRFVFESGGTVDLTTSEVWRIRNLRITDPVSPSTRRRMF